MSYVKEYPFRDISKYFIEPEYLEKDKENFFYRNHNLLNKKYRNLTAREIEILIKNNNIAENWNNIFVLEEFNPKLVNNCEFYGYIYIGKLSEVYLQYNDLKLPVGLYNSTIISCEIGDNVVIRNVNFLSHYIINDNVILFNINEMLTTDHAKFGNGILKEGEEEKVRIWLEVGNENSGRKILPFDKMLCSDAYIWYKFREDSKLMEKLLTITENSYCKKRGYYGVIGKGSIIKHTRIIKDVNVGENAYIKGANKLKNLTILSSIDEPTQIGEGTELVNGIIGYGSKIFYGCKCVRFVIGRNCQVKYGARVINTVLGDNSTVSCCELLNNLIFPFHEQHHNTSFLIATTVLGQSNIAAGATIGSNHNSRAPDGEIIAGRGFWPGLCTNFKHNSKFASFVLVAKGNYQYELNILYPFSLVSIYKNQESIKIMPAYWFMFNMYAMARNINKFKNRDKRKRIEQHIEIDYLAPDTVSEILYAIERLEYLAGLKLINEKDKEEYENILVKGKEFFSDSKNNDKSFVLFDEICMKKYGAFILKPFEAIESYKKMILYFVINTLVNFFDIKNKTITFKDLIERIYNLNKEPLYIEWLNLGGQIIPKKELMFLIDNIKNGIFKSWDDIHNKYNELWDKYPIQKSRYSLFCLEKMLNKSIDGINISEWKALFLKAIEIKKYILKNAFESREKDYNDPFRKIVYSSEEEMIAVLGRLEDNQFLKELKNETEEFIQVIKRLIKEH